MFKIIQT